MCKTYAYLRVSTDRQDLDNQRLEITNYAQANGLRVDEWLEVEVSSRKSERQRRIEELLASLKREDTLVVSEISRLARSMREVHNIIHDLMGKKVKLHVIKQNLRTNGENDMTTKIVINSFAMAAELERDLISQRTKNGLARAKAQGKKLGNPQLHETLLGPRIAKADAFAEGLRPVLSGFLASGLTQRQIVDELNSLGVKTTQGKAWGLTQVQRVIKRLGLSTSKAKG